MDKHQIYNSVNFKTKPQQHRHPATNPPPNNWTMYSRSWARRYRSSSSNPWTTRSTIQTSCLSTTFGVLKLSKFCRTFPQSPIEPGSLFQGFIQLRQASEPATHRGPFEVRLCEIRDNQDHAASRRLDS